MNGTENVLEDNNVELGFLADDWETAMQQACHLLLQNGYIEARYIKATIDAVKRFGPYIVLAPGIAFAHARPEDGVIRTGLSLLTLAKPVCFGHIDNDPVDIVIAIASSDHYAHVQILKGLSDFLSEDENIQFIRESTTATAIVKKVNSQRGA